MHEPSSDITALLSDHYRALNAELHRVDPNYGTTSRRFVDDVRRLARKHGARRILDFGCGKRELSKALSGEFTVIDFDPAIPGLDARPEPAELVVCIDVLEHVEPEYLKNVLADLARVTISVGLLTIATRPGGKRLSDGSSCHRIVETGEWWRGRLEPFFHVAEMQVADQGSLWFIVCPRQ